MRKSAPYSTRKRSWTLLMPMPSPNTCPMRSLGIPTPLSSITITSRPSSVSVLIVSSPPPSFDNRLQKHAGHECIEGVLVNLLLNLKIVPSESRHLDIEVVVDEVEFF